MDQPFTPDEQLVLARYFTNSDRPVFGLINLPEVVKGALFARYSRSPKSLRRLFLDEFYKDPAQGTATLAETMGQSRAEKLYEKVFTEYGDDSVAQLGGAHLACEDITNVLTKIVERPRLASYLEQSTRYIVYDQRRVSDGHWKYAAPAEIADPALRAEFDAVMDGLFTFYARLVPQLQARYEQEYPRDAKTALAPWQASIRAKACDVARGLLPAAVLSNVGVYGSGQAYEMMLLRMFAHPLAEARECAASMLAELRHIIPAFLRRVDMPERGGKWSAYYAGIHSRMEEAVASLDLPASPPTPDVDLVEWDPDGEEKVLAAALFEHTDLPTSALEAAVRAMSADAKESLLAACVGERTNRRHRPGRAFERTDYKFDCVTDYGCFRDLQRHRMLTIDWQALGTSHGCKVPADLALVPGSDAEWTRHMDRAAELAGRVRAQHGPLVAQYGVPFAYKIRFTMQMNAREAMHLLELRTQEQGHTEYRRVCNRMFELIRDKARHRLLAGAMKYIDPADYDLGRLHAEKRTHARMEAQAGV
ncbi:MAG: FAD-dependent thymidylate synthase [Gluconacetobacter diazotrophicus]|nr:FAD-dependent thymidylate synthase [Gluconacetobacter diazotrophicus]